MRLLRRCPRTAAALAALALSGVPLDADGPVGEYEVKAAFLYNFARFVEWPSEALPPGAPFVVAVLGTDPFQGVLEQTLAGKAVNGRPVEVRHLEALPLAGPAPQIVFVPASEAAQLPRVLLQVQSLPVLTVGDTEGFAQKGVIVNFVVRQRRVRFEVNLARAEQARLKISSQLLQLATLVSGEK